MKSVAWLRKARYKGEEKIDWLFTLSAAAYNMVRMRNLGELPQAKGKNLIRMA